MTKQLNDSPWPALAFAFGMAIITTVASIAGVHYMQRNDGKNFAEATELVGGDPVKGRDAMRRYGCAACHIIPGVTGARGLIGPTLAGFSNRTAMPNGAARTPELVIQWIINPIGVDPNATMPAVGVSDRDARDIATYLYALK